MKRLLNIVLPVLGKKGLLKYSAWSILSGVFSFLFVSFVTQVVGLLMSGRFTAVSTEYSILFAAVILLFIWVRRALSAGMIRLSQAILWKLRKQILSVVLKASYQELTPRKTRIQTAVMEDVNILMEISLSVIDFVRSGILALCCLAYLFTISFVLFCITLGIALLGVAVYQLTAKRNLRDFAKARELENRFQEDFMSVLNGFREIYMEPQKGKYINEQKINPLAGESYVKNVRAFTGYLNNQIIGQVLFYLLIASVLLVFSVMLNIKPGSVVSFVFTLIYLLSAIETIMILLPRIARAQVSANNLVELKTELENAGFDNPIPAKYMRRSEFERISAGRLEFCYGENSQAFAIGPVNFDIQKGETVFIYGANGSGKTTFIQALLGVLKPSAGEIRLNDTLVKESGYPEYKALFSVVFSDFYLFNELLTTADPDIEKWEYYLCMFELQGKVKLEGKKFSTTDLSAGQRKRLALIAALMEEKPVLVLDEWAADQDPYFRKKFYTEIIPALRKEDITIIAITHDDRYYHCADKLYKMEEGKLVEENAGVYDPAYIPL
jgi:putative ATP-binding cassette transporter